MRSEVATRPLRSYFIFKPKILNFSNGQTGKRAKRISNEANEPNWRRKKSGVNIENTICLRAREVKV